MSIEDNVTRIKNLISDYEKKYGREYGAVQLLAVSKNQSVDKMLAAYQAGLIYFGENYLQEALVKIAALSDKQIEWHFIGPIQSNKTRKIAENFSWVHSVDSIKIAKRLNDQRPTHLPRLNICIEVNIDNETTKSGISIDEVSALADYCQTLTRLKLRGLMTMPAAHDDINAQRHAYHKLHALWQDLRLSYTLDTLSMGLSNDFEAAIAEGATIIRIGRAIFGER